MLHEVNLYCVITDKEETKEILDEIILLLL